MTAKKTAERTMEEMAANEDSTVTEETLAAEMRVTFEANELSDFFSGFEPLLPPIFDLAD